MTQGGSHFLQKTRLVISIFLITSLGLAACAAAAVPATANHTPAEPTSPPAEPTFTLPPDLTVEELGVQILALAKPLSSPKAQFSGMSWYGDWLVLLPQYPSYFQSEGMGALIAISKTELLAVLDGESTSPLEPRFIALDDQGLMGQIRGFEGFECIAFHQDTVYLSIEAQPSKMLGYLVKGSVESDSNGLPTAIRLDPVSLVEIQPQAPLDNFSDETCLVYNEQVISLYEANGANVNPAPQAHVFDLDLQPQGSLPFPNIEYRITDATQPDAQGQFWAINYLYPGDLDKLQPLETQGLDALAQQYGVGETHAAYVVVERLIQFQIRAEGIQRVDAPPLQFSLVDNLTARNWEGIVMLDQRGFLLVTDSFPGTQLGFVPYPP